MESLNVVYPNPNGCKGKKIPYRQSWARFYDTYVSGEPRRPCFSCSSSRKCVRKDRTHEKEELHSLLNTLASPIALNLVKQPIYRTSTNDHGIFFRERIRRDLQIQRRGTLSRSAGDIVVGAVAGTEPAAEVAGFANGDAAEMCADAWCIDVSDYQPFVHKKRRLSKRTYPA